MNTFFTRDLINTDLNIEHSKNYIVQNEPCIICLDKNTDLIKGTIFGNEVVIKLCAKDTHALLKFLQDINEVMLHKYKSYRYKGVPIVFDESK